MLAEACGFTGELLGLNYMKTEVLSILADVFPLCYVSFSKRNMVLVFNAFFAFYVMPFEGAGHCVPKAFKSNGLVQIPPPQPAI